MGKMNVLVKAAAAISGESLIESILTDLYELAKKAGSQKLKLWHIRKVVSRLHRHVQKIRLVKTLWQVDKAIDLKQFYCDSRLIIDGKRTIVRTLSDLGKHRRVLISGIAGQGKSILLRYMCSNALAAGECIPVFVELRRIMADESIIDHVHLFLGQIGLSDLDENTLRALLLSGKVVLFLDGFDEVPEIEKPGMVHDIENIALSFDDLRIVITSRPESGIEVSPLFDVVKLSDLVNGEYKTVIYKLTDDSAFADNLIKQIEAHKSKLQELLCTPLLVTLLVMSYKSFQELPEQLSEFYDSIFQVLLQRHDGAKPGFKRPRRCAFNDNQYRSVFEGMCYESKRKVKSIFVYDDVVQFAKASLAKYRLTDDPDKYIEDIIKVTCLILREGKDYRFIHRSVQEYYASAFIKHRSEPVAKKFYEQMIDLGPYGGTWQQELRFLSEIDRYRHNKYYYLPYLCRVIECTDMTVPAAAPVADIGQTIRLMGAIRVGFGALADNPLTCVSMTATPLVSFKYIERIFRLDFSEVVNAVEDKRIVPIESPIRHSRRPTDDERYYVTIQQIIEAGFLVNKLISITQALLSDNHAQAVETRDMITAEESVDVNINIDIE